jgi:hypothetical protein
MGCDIHFYVERRLPDGSWEAVDEFVKEGDGVYSYETVKNSYYDDRNYDTFAILANVRNGVGFAGVDTGHGFFPIAMPKGFPDDISPKLREFLIENENGGDHTPSWLTLDEIMAFDWTQRSVKSGVVSLSEWAYVQMGYKPREWCGSIGGPGIVVVQDKQMGSKVREDGSLLRKLLHEPKGDEAARVAASFHAAPGRLYVQVEWGVAYYEAAANFLSRTIPRLWRLGKPEDVRLVFNFDS